jgi:hypothetical protein
MGLGFVLGVTFTKVNNKKLIGAWKAEQGDLRVSSTDEKGNTVKAGSYKNTVAENTILIFTQDKKVYIDSIEYEYKYVNKTNILIDRRPSQEKLEILFENDKLILSGCDEEKNIDYTVEYERLIK